MHVRLLLYNKHKPSAMYLIDILATNPINTSINRLEKLMRQFQLVD